MVTYLSALRWAVNVEQALQKLQKRRFALTGDTGARALPPLIPLSHHRVFPEFAWLDEIRRAHTVSVASTPPQSAEIPPARITLTGGDLDETAQHIMELQRALSADEQGETPAWTPQIVLSWQDAPPQTTPIALPETSALWLSVFELRLGTDPWWEYLSWNQRYCRRVKAQ